MRVTAILLLTLGLIYLGPIQDLSAAETKKEDVKVTKQVTGLKTLFPNGFAYAEMAMSYGNNTSTYRVSENATYEYTLGLGSTFIDKRWKVVLELNLAKDPGSRNIAIGNTNLFNNITLYKNDFFKTFVATETYFPSGAGATRTNNLLYLKNVLHNTFKTGLGNFTPAIEVRAQNQVRSTPVFSDVPKNDKKASLRTETVQQRNPVTDLGVYTGTKLDYSHPDLKGFYIGGRVFYVNKFKSNGSDSKYFSLENWAGYSLTDNWGISHYIYVYCDKDFNPQVKSGQKGIYEEISLSYSF